MLFLLANWRWLIPTAASLALGIMLGVTRMELVDLRAANATALAKATEAARAKDAENATLAQQIEVAHGDAAKAIQDAADAARDLAHTRGLFVRTSACVPRAAHPPGIPDASPAEARLDQPTADALIAIASDGDRAASYAQSCFEWAAKVGR